MCVMTEEVREHLRLDRPIRAAGAHGCIESRWTHYRQPRRSPVVSRAVVETWLLRAVEQWPRELLEQLPYNWYHGYQVTGVPCHFSLRAGDVGLAEADRVYASVRRVCGWLRAVPEYPLLAAVMRRGLSPRGMGSPANLVSPIGVAQRLTSPGQAERWLRATRRKANLILRGWGLRAAHAELALVLAWFDRRGLSERESDRERGPKTASKIVAAGTLQRVFGESDVARNEWSGSGLMTQRPWWEVIASYRTWSALRSGDHSTVDADPNCEWLGTRGEDDIVSIWRPVLVCACRDGAILADREVTPATARTATTHVVVRCPSRGLRHYLGVPPQFAMPLRSNETASQRIRAAVAWTFTLGPDQFRPELET